MPNYVLDQKQETTNDGLPIGYNTSNQDALFEFKPAVSADLGKITVKIYKGGSPSGTIGCSIYTAANALIATSATTFSCADMDGASREFIFAAGAVALTAETQYRCVISTTNSLSTSNYNGVNVGYIGGANPYTRSDFIGHKNGGSFDDQYNDRYYYFLQYYILPDPTPSVVETPTVSESVQLSYSLPSPTVDTVTVTEDVNMNQAYNIQKVVNNLMRVI